MDQYWKDLNPTSVKAIAIIIKRKLRTKDSNYLSEKSPLSIPHGKINIKHCILMLSDSSGKWYKIEQSGQICQVSTLIA